MKIIMKGYEIVLLILNNEEMVDILYCIDYIKKWLVCFCNKCRELVCIDCIIYIYNGYFVDFLFNVYVKFKDIFENKKVEIENNFFLLYCELLKEENVKSLVFIKRVDEMEKKMKRYEVD